MESFEYAIKKDVRNNPIVLEVDEARQRELWKSVGVAGFLVAVLLFSAWQHFELLRHGYQIEEMQRDRAAEEETARRLRLEIETLKSPKRIEALATQRLRFVVAPLVIAAICFWDGFTRSQRGRFETSTNRTRTWLFPAVKVTVALLIAGLNLAFAWDARRNYESFSALNFPGASHVRVEPDKAAALRAIVSRINSSCGTLVTEPGLFSFHLWTGKRSLPGVDHQVWMSLLDDAAQNAIAEGLALDPRACVVYQRDVVDLWTNRTDVSSKPLVRFIRENFHKVIEGSGYSLMMRNGPAD
jgi:cell division protein FtsL